MRTMIIVAAILMAATSARNEGPRCLDEDHLHSWCWVKDGER